MLQPKLGEVVEAWKDFYEVVRTEWYLATIGGKRFESGRKEARRR